MFEVRKLHFFLTLSQEKKKDFLGWLTKARLNCTLLFAILITGAFYSHEIIAFDCTLCKVAPLFNETVKTKIASC